MRPPLTTVKHHDHVAAAAYLMKHAPFRYARDVPDQVQRESSQRATTPVCPE